MAIFTGDVLQITDVQTYLSQVCLNVYFYRCTVADVDTDYAGVASAFLADMQTPVLAAQADAVQHYQVSIRNLTNGIDVYEEATNNYGANAGESLPSFVAYGFRLYRTNGTTRHGSKRYAGVMEAHVAGNTAVPAIQATLTAIANALKADITYPGTGTDEFTGEPVIVARYPQSHPDAGKLNISVLNLVADASFRGVTSQTTRRGGHGN